VYHRVLPAAAIREGADVVYSLSGILPRAIPRVAVR